MTHSGVETHLVEEKATMTAAVVRLAAERGETTELPLNPWLIGLSAFGLLTLLLVITLMFGKDR
ncbi:MAG: hypothetical protein ACRDV1_03570 [Actinomycetes bacterium]